MGIERLKCEQCPYQQYRRTRGFYSYFEYYPPRRFSACCVNPKMVERAADMALCEIGRKAILEDQA